MTGISKKIICSAILALLTICFTAPAKAIETAPRITDREIIEALAILKQSHLDINKRFDDVNKRFDWLQNTMLSLFGAIVALIIALFGYIAWDRRTALKPFQERFERLERDLNRDLDLQNEEGSRLTRLIKALRELAKNDKKVAEILGTFSLM